MTSRYNSITCVDRYNFLVQAPRLREYRTTKDFSCSYLMLHALESSLPYYYHYEGRGNHCNNNVQSTPLFITGQSYVGQENLGRVTTPVASIAMAI